MFDLMSGTQTGLMKGEVGQLEVELTVPVSANRNYIAILGHPHSLHGGTMHNKVVTTLVRAFSEVSIPSIRFNFRGVGESQGTYDAGVGESADMLALTQQYLTYYPDAQVIFAGFSFGSYVAYRSAAKHSSRLLITIAPSVEHFDYTQYPTQPAPWVVFQGDQDEVVSSKSVFEFAAQFELKLVRFQEAGHFFHGRLIELRAQLIDVITAVIQ